jgi:hypothetical protein
MPKWKPAIQNGRPVATGFTQPVTFAGVEEWSGKYLVVSSK